VEALLISTGVVALAEIGDKTQLLAFILAARFKKPLPIIAGILCATLVNHGLAGALGAWSTSVVNVEVMRWVLGLSFIGMAIWTMIPDKIEEELGDLLGEDSFTFESKRKKGSKKTTSRPRVDETLYEL